ncbi:hypothetical protein QFZ65_000659 [Arthrobacter sp. B3I9]|nr:hypothetical protein [Arthrobacter sp. B3I9]
MGNYGWHDDCPEADARLIVQLVRLRLSEAVSRAVS